MMPQMQMTLEVNGRLHRLVVEPRDTLVDVLRDRLGLTGTRRGCGEGVSSQSIVLVDDEPVDAGLIFAVQVHGRSVTTIEGLSAHGHTPLQAALVADGAGGSGAALPGLIMLLEGARRRGEDPDDLARHILSDGSGCTAAQHAVRLARTLERTPREPRQSSVFAEEAAAE